MSTRMLRLLVALLAAVLLAAGCGGDDDDEPETTTTEAAEDDGTSTTSEAEEATTTSEDTTDTTAAGGEGDDGTEGTEGEGAQGGPQVAEIAAIDDFCTLDAYATEMDDQIFDDTAGEMADPAEQQEMRVAVEALYARAAEVAPPELREDFALVSSGFSELFDLLEEYDYDSMALFAAMQEDPEVAARLEVLEAPEYQQASDNIQAWVDANC